MPFSNIDKPNKYFNTVTYAGAGTTTQSVTGTGFSPDFIWIKNRTDAYSHVLQDVCRGFGATKNLSSNSGNAEGASGATGDNYGHVSTSDSDGFTVTHTINGSNDGGTIRKGTHFSGNNYVAWCWDANGTGVSNTSGSITSTVSANTTSGFSVGTYTGNSTSDATIGHGLGVAPNMVIVKNRSGADNWQVYWNDGTERNGFLNLTNAFNTPASTSVWGNNNPTSSVFYVGNDTATNTSNNYVFYAFTSIKGYSKFGSYTGNGSADGSFVYLGFRPAMVIRKRTDAVQDWLIHDNRRTGINQTSNYISTLKPNSSTDEISFNEIDILSNGFKMRDTGTHGNASGGNYIYMAFAENPFVSSKGIACTAR
jgi:hypothetical protein